MQFPPDVEIRPKSLAVGVINARLSINERQIVSRSKRNILLRFTAAVAAAAAAAGNGYC